MEITSRGFYHGREDAASTGLLIKDCDVAALANALSVTANDLFEGCQG